MVYDQQHEQKRTARPRGSRSRRGEHVAALRDGCDHVRPFPRDESTIAARSTKSRIHSYRNMASFINAIYLHCGELSMYRGMLDSPRNPVESMLSPYSLFPLDPTRESPVSNGLLGSTIKSFTLRILLSLILRRRPPIP